QEVDTGVMFSSSQRVFPTEDSPEYPVKSSSRPDKYLKRRFSSCSQYQSDETSVRLRKRASLLRSSPSASARKASRSIYSRANDTLMAISSSNRTRSSVKYPTSSACTLSTPTHRPCRFSGSDTMDLTPAVRESSAH